MVKPAKEIPAGEFKATCLRLLDQVSSDGQEFIVTKRGKPVARVVPIAVAKKIKRVPPPALKGTLIRFDRPNDPIFDPPEEWPDDPA